MGLEPLIQDSFDEGRACSPVAAVSITDGVRSHADARFSDDFRRQPVDIVEGLDPGRAPDDL